MSDSIVYISVELGHVHTGVERNGILLTPEACNVDQALRRERLDSIEDVPSAELCARCFPTTQDEKEAVAP